MPLADPVNAPRPTICATSEMAFTNWLLLLLTLYFGNAEPIIAPTPIPKTSSALTLLPKTVFVIMAFEVALNKL